MIEAQGTVASPEVLDLSNTHRHINRSSSKEAILFSMSDSPLLKSLELYREESVSQ